MADTRFLANLQGYAKDAINAEMIDLLTPYFTNSIYTYENAKTACGNVAGLIAWTLAMADFYKVNRDVLPLKANLARQQAKLEKAHNELSSAMQLLETKEKEVKECQEEYDKAMKLKQVKLLLKTFNIDFVIIRKCWMMRLSVRIKWTKRQL